jgi:hypothetical protein
MIQRESPTFSEFLDRTREEPVYVILGVQGSGTNLLIRLLRRIFNFSILRDRSLVFNAAARLGAAPSPDAVAREIGHVKAHLFPSTLTRKRTRFAIRDNKHFAGFEPELISRRVSSGAELARLVYAYRAFSSGTSRMGVKSDDIWENIGAIDEVIPNRRIVLITRDFRDNLVSITGKPWGPVEPLQAAHYVKKRFAPYAVEYRRVGRRGFHVKFSTLVTSTRKFVDDFSSHFDLTPSEDPDAVIKAFNFRPGKIDKWRRLPADQLTWCEGILYDEMVEFGYTPLSPAPALPGPLNTSAAVVRDTLRRVPQKLQTLVRMIQR